MLTQCGKGGSTIFVVAIVALTFSIELPLGVDAVKGFPFVDVPKLLGYYGQCAAFVVHLICLFDGFCVEFEIEV